MKHFFTTLFCIVFVLPIQSMNIIKKIKQSLAPQAQPFTEKTYLKEWPSLHPTIKECLYEEKNIEVYNCLNSKTAKSRQSLNLLCQKKFHLLVINETQKTYKVPRTPKEYIAFLHKHNIITLATKNIPDNHELKFFYENSNQKKDFHEWLAKEIESIHVRKRQYNNKQRIYTYMAATIQAKNTKTNSYINDTYAHITQKIKKLYNKNNTDSDMCLSSSPSSFYSSSPQVVDTFFGEMEL